jgi:hypothetical protein
MLPLITRSQNSFGRSLQSTQEIVDFAVSSGSPVVALTDYHSLSAMPSFLEECRNKGVHGIAGLTVNIIGEDGIQGELVLLGKGDEGLQSLTDLHRIVGDVGNDSKYNPQRGLNWVELNNGEYDNLFKNLICLDGFPGSLAESLVTRNGGIYTTTSVGESLEDPRSLLSSLRNRFSPDDYIGVQTPGVPSPLASMLSSLPDADGDVRQNPSCAVESLMGFAKNRAQLNQSKTTLLYYSRDYLKNELKLNKSEAIKWANNKMGDGHLDANGDSYKPSTPSYLSANDLVVRCPSPTSILRRGVKFDLLDDDAIKFEKQVENIWAEYKKFLKDDEIPLYQERMDDEMKVISQTGFQNYFTNVFTSFHAGQDTQNHMMLRGSAVSSIIMHMAGMTDINAIEEGLIFRRFLSEDREEDPDVDMDIAHPSEILQSLGEGKAKGRVGTSISYSGVKKLSVRFEMAKDCLCDFYESVNDQQRKEAERFVQMFVKRTPQSLQQDLDGWKESVWTNLPNDVKNSSVAKALVGIASNFESAKFSVSRSASSVVISRDGFDHLPQVENPDSDQGSIAFDKRELSAVGLLKYDFLANRYFTRNVNALTSAGIDPMIRISKDDPSVNFAFSRGALLGLTQMNGFVGPKLQERMKPKSFNDVSAMSAMIRDGGDPSFEAIIDQYVEGKNNPDSINLPPLAQKILSGTYGSLLYEEQLLTLMTDVAGMSFNDADKLRSGIKKKKYERIDEMRRPFVDGAMKKHGISEEDASAIYALVESKRGRFLFSQAHSMAYANLCLKEVWAKCHHPAEFYAECFMDSRFKPSKTLALTPIPNPDKNSMISLANNLGTMLGDWEKLNGGRSANSIELAKGFVVAMGKVIIRDHGKRNRETRRSPSTVSSAVEMAIDNGMMDFLLPGGVSDRELMKKFNESVFSRVEAKVRVSAPTVSNTRVQQNGQNSASKSASKGNGDLSTMSVVGEGKEPALNRREKRYLNTSDFKKIPFPSMLHFMHEEGLITLTEAKDSGSGRATYSFYYTDPSGARLHEKVKGMSTDPSKMGEYSSPPNLAMFQGGKFNQVSISSRDFYYAIVSAKHQQGWPQPALKEGSSKFFELAYDPNGPDTQISQQNKAFFKVAHSYILNAKTPLHDDSSIGIISKRQILEPSAPVINDQHLFKSTRKKSMEQIEYLFGVTRGIGAAEIQRQMQDGSLSASKSWSDDWMKSKKGTDNAPYRKNSTDPLSNHRLVSDTIPLFEMHPNPGVGIAEGGHQRFYFKRENGRAGKMDLNKTTKGKRGAVCGAITAGSDTLWLTEATIDTFSFNELQGRVEELKLRRPDLTSLEFAEPNSLSVRSAGMAEVFLEQLLSIEITKSKTAEGSLDFCEVTREPLPSPMNDGTKESLKAWFKTQTVHWYSDGSAQDHKAKGDLVALLTEAGMSHDEIKKSIKTHLKKGNDSDSYSIQQIFKEHIKTERDSFLSMHNIDNWFNSCGLDVVQGPDGSRVAGEKNMGKTRGRNFSSMSDGEKQTLRSKLTSKFMKLTGAQSLGVALDADMKNGKPGAGRIDAQVVLDACALIGIPTGSHMPEPSSTRELGVKTPSGENTELKDHNDYLMVIVEMEKAGDKNGADDLLIKYASSLKKPSVAHPKIAQKRAAEAALKNN